MDSLCLSALVDSLIDAAHLFGYRERRTKYPVSEKRMVVARESYAFICGTGLDKMIKFYDMDFDPDELRSKFMDLWK